MIIFLDIDGVLNAISKKPNRPENSEGLTYAEYMAYDIDEDKVQLLNEIIKETSCKIVISSSWRKKKQRNSDEFHGFAPDEMQKILECRGFVGEVIDQTKILYPPKLSGYICRAEEIHEWLERHLDVQQFVILDDCEIFYLDMYDAHKNRKFEYMRDKFVKTNGMYGLTTKNVKQAIKILNNG